MISNMNHKVIIVTPGGSFFRDPHARAFEKVGYKPILFNSRHGFVYNPIFRKISRRVRPLRYLKNLQVYLINQHLIRLVKKHKPKLLFAQKAETISPQTIETIKNLGVVTINFYNDLMGEWQVISKIAPHYNYFFNQDHIVLKKLWYELGLKNCFYMNHSAEPLLDPFTNRQDKYPISFIGTYNKEVYPNREKYLEAIKDLGLHIWGNDEWQKTSLCDCFHGRAHGDERFDIYSKSKIVVDINWDNFLAEGLSNRPFEVAGCGALFMTDNVRADIYRAYEVGKEVIVFTDEGDLRQKVEYYLKNEKERDNIAKAGYIKTITKHTYTKRIEQLLDTIDNPEKYLYK